jgi:hypothetical protein
MQVQNLRQRRPRIHARKSALLRIGDLDFDALDRGGVDGAEAVEEIDVPEVGAERERERELGESLRLNWRFGSNGTRTASPLASSS